MHDDIFRALQSCGFTRNQVEQSLSEASYDPYVALDILQNNRPETQPVNNAAPGVVQEARGGSNNSSTTYTRLEQLLVLRLLSNISREDVTARAWMWHNPVIRASRCFGLSREHVVQALALNIPDHYSTLRVIQTWARRQPDQLFCQLFCNDFTQELLLCIPSDFSIGPGGCWFNATVKAVMSFGFRMNQVTQALWHMGFDPYKALCCLVNSQYVFTAQRVINRFTELRHHQQQTLLVEAARRRPHM